MDYQDGLCLPMAISHRCFAAAARTPTNRLRLRSAQDETVLDIDARTLAPETVTGWPAYVAGVLWALGSRISGASTRGMDILIDGQVPLGAGLSSSAALECSAAEAIEDLLSLGTEPLERVRAAITAETDFAGASTGGLDQSASVLSREGHALFLDCRDFSTRPVPWDLASQGLALLITDTRAEHSHVVDGEYTARRADSERAAQELGVATLRDVDAADVAALESLLAQIPDEVVPPPCPPRDHRDPAGVRDVDALLAAGAVREHVAELGALLNASHDSLRDDYEVTVPQLDVAVEAARAARGPRRPYDRWRLRRIDHRTGRGRAGRAGGRRDRRRLRRARLRQPGVLPRPAVRRGRAGPLSRRPQRMMPDSWTGGRVEETRGAVGAEVSHSWTPARRRCFTCSGAAEILMEEAASSAISVSSKPTSRAVSYWSSRREPNSSGSSAPRAICAPASTSCRRGTSAAFSTTPSEALEAGHTSSPIPASMTCSSRRGSSAAPHAVTQPVGAEVLDHVPHVRGPQQLTAVRHPTAARPPGRCGRRGRTPR